MYKCYLTAMKKTKNNLSFDNPQDLFNEIPVGKCIEMEADIMGEKIKMKGCRPNKNKITMEGNLGGEEVKATIKMTDI